MKYKTENIVNKYNNIEKIDFLFFWNEISVPDIITKSCLSQWYDCYFTVDSVTYHTAEQYMMARKAILFKDMDTYTKIMDASNPEQYKALGRQVNNFDRCLWDRNKYNIVVNGNIAKFSQNEELKNYLLSTQKTILVEASPFDKIWGIGMQEGESGIDNPNNWRGLNLMGLALMEVRDYLR